MEDGRVGQRERWKREMEYISKEKSHLSISGRIRILKLTLPYPAISRHGKLPYSGAGQGRESYT